MKKSAYKTGIFLAAALMLLTLNITAQEEIKKEFHKEYTVQKGARLDLNNRYGAIVIETSETNQVVIDAIVKVRYPNKEKAEKLMGYIDVQFTEAENLISAKTVINEKFNFSGWFGESRRFSIDYNVKMPVWMDLNLTNRYGNSDLDDLEGQVNIDIKYGKVDITKLTRGNEKPLNTIEVAYGDGVIGEAGWLDLNTRYCGSFSVTKGQAFLLDSRYSKISIGSASSVVGEVKYDNIRIENIGNLVLEADYTDVNIGTLTKKLSLTGGYGGFNAEKVAAGFESISIDTHYTGVRVGIDPSASYNLEAKTSYCSLKYNEENFRVKRRIVENTSSEIEGIVGKEASPTATVKVSSSYGSVKLY